MKARITETAIVLSISLIVKNEQRNINRVLEFIKPLLDCVRSELVIVDTGSTDNTVAIAKKYTDKIYHFDWCDDFAAARNFGLEKCTGEWFMFIDADEFLDQGEGLKDLIHFFTTPEINKKYNTVTCNRRDYVVRKNLEAYHITILLRIMRRHPDIKFVGAIHEYLNCAAPEYNSSAIFHHWGYAEETMAKKQKRNSVIIRKEYEKNPDDLRMLGYMISICKDDDYDEKFLLEALERTKLLPRGEFYKKRLLNHIASAFAEKNNDKVMETADVFFSEYPDPDGAYLDMLETKCSALFDEERYAEFLPACERLFELWELYAKGEFNRPGAATDTRVTNILIRKDTEYCMLRAKDALGQISVREVRKYIAGIEPAETALRRAGAIYLGVKYNVDITEIMHAIKDDAELSTEIYVEIKSKKYGEDCERAYLTYLHNDGLKKMPVMLSISLITKNEEKNLDRCLSALKPLMEAVPSELIVVDTGSTDNSVEIAKKYTDKVFHFDWCDDFAAARNRGVEQCTGQWFMCIDSDEFLDEDISDMVKFWNDPLLQMTHHCASYKQRNYKNKDSKKEYSDFSAMRVSRRYEGFHYKSPIHECFETRPPLYEFNTVVHHWGYAGENNEEKSRRNLPIMQKEYDKNPGDFRMATHILASSGYDRKEFIEKVRKRYSERESDVPENQRTHYRSFLNKSVSILAAGNPEKAIEIADEYFEKFGEKNMLAIDTLFFKLQALKKLDRLEEAHAAYERFFELRAMFMNGEIDKFDRLLSPVTFENETEFIKISGDYAELSEKLGKNFVQEDTPQTLKTEKFEFGDKTFVFDNIQRKL